MHAIDDLPTTPGTALDPGSDELSDDDLASVAGGLPRAYTGLIEPPPEVALFGRDLLGS